MALALGPGEHARAASDESCAIAQSLDKYRLLRRLSLDLTHQLPSYEELLALDDTDEIDEAVVDALLSTDRFRIMARRFHEKLLWPNLDKVQLTDFNHRMAKQKSGPVKDIFIYIASARKNVYRGDTTLSCLNEEQVEYLEGEVAVAGGGTLSYRYPKPIVEGEKAGQPTRQEGYVWVAPYWDPANPVKVCAYDAQDALIVPAFKKNGSPVTDAQGNVVTLDCTGGIVAARCGAGGNLRWAWALDAESSLWDAFREQLGRFVDDFTVGVAGENLPYSEILTATHTYANGKVKYFKKYLAEATNLSKTFNHWMVGDIDVEAEPDFADAEWVRLERNQVDGQSVDSGHSGILTLAAYTLRFQTNRARANRFRTVFTGQYFIPADSIEVPELDGCSDDSDDLTARCSCRGCHQVLEPMAAYWGGTVADAGSALISDRSVFPEYYEECDPTVMPGTLSQVCNRFYQTDPDQEGPGVLLAYQFARSEDSLGVDSELDILHTEIRQNLEAGPVVLAQKVIDSGQFHATMVQNIFEHFMGRELNLNPSLPNNEVSLWNDLSAEFRDHDNFRAIVKRIVMLEQYRRVR